MTEKQTIIFLVTETFHYFRCKDDNMLLNDNSGRHMYELKCDDKTDPDNPSTADVSTWPTCVNTPMCNEIPEPDNNATVSIIKYHGSF